MSGGPPAWLENVVEVRGAQVRWGVRGDGDRTLVLVHGHTAHHRWWHAVEERLTARWRLVLLDLSGHGESDHRNGYENADWIEDVIGVVQADGARRPVVVGHSMGGRVSLTAAGTRPDLFRGVVMLDSAVWVTDRAGRDQRFPWRPERTTLVHPEREALLRRFRLVPDQPEPAPEMLRPLLDYSIRPEAGGWTWKHDQRGLPGVVDDDIHAQLATSPIPIHHVRAGASDVVGEAGRAMLSACRPPGGLRLWEVPGAYHHLVLDSPDETAAVIETAASSVYHSEEHAGTGR